MYDSRHKRSPSLGRTAISLLFFPPRFPPPPWQEVLQLQTVWGRLLFACLLHSGQKKYAPTQMSASASSHAYSSYGRRLGPQFSHPIPPLEGDDHDTCQQRKSLWATPSLLRSWSWFMADCRSFSTVVWIVHATLTSISFKTPWKLSVVPDLHYPPSGGRWGEPDTPWRRYFSLIFMSC